MGPVFDGSGNDTTESADGQNDEVFNFEISRRRYIDDKSPDIETKESDMGDDDTIMNKVDNDPITLKKDYGFSFKNPRKSLENLQPRGNIVRDAMMFVRPDLSEDDDGLEDVLNDNEAVASNAAALANPLVNQNSGRERDATASLTSEVATSSNPSIHGDGIISSRPTEENEEAEETFPERANIFNLPGEVISNAVTGKVKQIVTAAGQEMSLVGNVNRINARALPKDAETYQLETFEKNAMIIFNQENIVGYKKPREGTKQDVDALKKTFSRFGFEIDLHNDLRRDEIFKELDSFSKQNFTDHGCIAVVILTHGSDMGSLRAKDRRFYETDVINYFRTSVNDNQTLVTKPILILIQACRGSKISKAKLVGQAGTVRKDTDDEEIQPYTLPVEADMLVLHSTYPGKVSHRNDLYGSWFIQTLCEKINQLSPSQDLDSIMTATKRAVATDMEHSSWNRKSKQYELIKQMPIITSTLIRKLFLRRYEGLIPKSITRDFESQVDACIYAANIDDTEYETDEERIQNCKCSFFISSSYFGYLKAMLRHFVEDPSNSEDTMAKSYLNLACTYKDSADFQESKEEMAKIITEHLKKNARHLEYYKFLYLNNFAKPEL